MRLGAPQTIYIGAAPDTVACIRSSALACSFICAAQAARCTSLRSYRRRTRHGGMNSWPVIRNFGYIGAAQDSDGRCRITCVQLPASVDADEPTEPPPNQFCTTIAVKATRLDIHPEKLHRSETHRRCAEICVRRHTVVVKGAEIPRPASRRTRHIDITGSGLRLTVQC